MIDTKPDKLFLSEELEQGLVAALVNGLIGLDTVPRESLSGNGQAVCNGVEFLLSAGNKAPFTKATVVATACDVAGADKTTLRPYLDKALKAGDGKESADIVAKLYQQQALNELINEASRQMSAREFDARALLSKLDTSETNDLVPACDMLINGEFPQEPTGYSIPGLPMLTEASGGVMGVWAIGGKAKLGKSTLGVQVALGMPVPVLYYDMENGPATMLYRMGKYFGGNKQAFRERTKTFYIRRSIKTLDKDLRKVKAPALIVVDSVQKLPTNAKDRRSGIDGWLSKFERLKEDGYTTLLISEVNGFGGYKETGEIEYTVDFGMQLRRDGDYITATVVANRHRPAYGDICALERVNDWMFRESDDLGTAQEDVDL